MTDEPPGRDRDELRVDAPSERHLPSRHRPVEPGLLEAGVYASRPLRGLRDAVLDALGSPSREDVGRGLDTGPLWREPVLWARLVQAVGDHARRCGAGRIVAADPDVVPLASAVAERLVMPLERRRSAGEQGGGHRAAYLVARVLHETKDGRFFSGEGRGGRRPPDGAAGAGALFRIRAPDAGRASTRNILHIIDL